MQINGKFFHEVATIEKITIADSFVVRQNKLGSGNGEAKLYIGNDSETLRAFYGNRGFISKCFFLKSDLIKFLNDLRSEYKSPQLPYQNKSALPNLFDVRLDYLNTLRDQLIFYSIEDQNQIAGPRVYVNSNDDYYQLLRELPLPDLCYLSIRKLSADDGETLFYTRLFTDYRDSFGETTHPSIIQEEDTLIEENTNLSIDERLQTVRARVGQGKYRKKLLEECPFCPVTLVSDDRLLIASHIKPWAVSSLSEKTDPKNGFMFTPTIDYLFDQGFITFEDDKKIIVSPWISSSTVSRLNLRPNSTISLLPISGREGYLAYHREAIFKR